MTHQNLEQIRNFHLQGIKGAVIVYYYKPLMTQ